LGPELQKQQAERNGDFSQQHTDTLEQVNAVQQPTEQKVEALPPNQTIISNTDSIGKSVKEAVQETTNQDVVEKSWPGLSIFKWSFGGATSPREDTSSKTGREESV